MMTDKEMRNVLMAYQQGIEFLWAWDSATLHKHSPIYPQMVEVGLSYADIIELIAAMKEVGVGITGLFGNLREQGNILASIFGSHWLDVDDAFRSALILMVRIIRNHPFSDGNKRIGYATAVWFLTQNGVLLSERLVVTVLPSLALLAATTSLSEKEMVAWGIALMNSWVK